jgi:pimeloyl-ACP methyl ester carboxylesterase
MHALSLSRISTNVRFSASALLFPELAGAWAEHMFLTPPRSRDGAASALDLVDAKSSTLVHKGRHIATWTWGARSTEAPAVLLAHGWGGNAAQMRAFAFPLLQAGYRVIAYDQPAHGVSEGKLTGLPDFAEVLGAVAARHGGVEAIVAHSLGGAAAALSLYTHKVFFKKIVLVSPPSDLVGYSRRFARWYWMPEPVRKAMQTAIEDRYGVRWEDIELSRVAPRLAADALVIHDRDDRLMPWTHGASVARHWPGAQLMLTDGLGHRRILGDATVTRAAADFIAGRAPVEEQPPVPAPLY